MEIVKYKVFPEFFATTDQHWNILDSTQRICIILLPLIFLCTISNITPHLSPQPNGHFLDLLAEVKFLDS